MDEPKITDAPHAKGTRDVEAALDDIQKLLRAGRAVNLIETLKATNALATLRAALAELEDGHLTIARAIGMVDEDQGRIASVATAEAIAGAIGELRRTDDAKTDEWMCAGREAALAEQADPALEKAVEELERIRAGVVDLVNLESVISLIRQHAALAETVEKFWAALRWLEKGYGRAREQAAKIAEDYFAGGMCEAEDAGDKIAVRIRAMTEEGGAS